MQRWSIAAIFVWVSNEASFIDDFAFTICTMLHSPFVLCNKSFGFVVSEIFFLKFQTIIESETNISGIALNLKTFPP
jgi:hypothetical protein